MAGSGAASRTKRERRHDGGSRCCCTPCGSAVPRPLQFLSRPFITGDSVTVQGIGVSLQRACHGSCPCTPCACTCTTHLGSRHSHLTCCVAPCAGNIIISGIVTSVTPLRTMMRTDEDVLVSVPNKVRWHSCWQACTAREAAKAARVLRPCGFAIGDAECCCDCCCCCCCHRRWQRWSFTIAGERALSCAAFSAACTPAQCARKANARTAPTRAACSQQAAGAQPPDRQHAPHSKVQGVRAVLCQRSFTARLAATPVLYATGTSVGGVVDSCCCRCTLQGQAAAQGGAAAGAAAG